jgi:hypothetical protein
MESSNELPWEWEQSSFEQDSFEQDSLNEWNDEVDSPSFQLSSLKDFCVLDSYLDVSWDSWILVTDLVSDFSLFSHGSLQICYVHEVDSSLDLADFVHPKMQFPYPKVALYYVPFESHQLDAVLFAQTTQPTPLSAPRLGAIPLHHVMRGWNEVVV